LSHTQGARPLLSVCQKKSKTGKRKDLPGAGGKCVTEQSSSLAGPLPSGGKITHRGGLGYILFAEGRKGKNSGISDGRTI